MLSILFQAAQKLRFGFVQASLVVHRIKVKIKGDFKNLNDEYSYSQC